MEQEEPVYIKYRVEGWIQVDHLKPFERRGIELLELASEMSEGNGYCTLWEEITRETKNHHPTMEDCAMDFFMIEEDDYDE